MQSHDESIGFALLFDTLSLGKMHLLNFLSDIRWPKKWAKEKVCKSKIYRLSLRRERDSNPRYLAVHRFSRPAHSTTLTSLQDFFRSTNEWVIFELRCKGSNFFWTVQVFCEVFLRKVWKKCFLLLFFSWKGVVRVLFRGCFVALCC